ncbi:unnamed protein product [Prorocentrum cordatum]|uniref:CS domain-containing protein n=1 Tax=Prorocentrum cordatum TaxID=2364126 RepID=A0ABN9UCL2_9DINO|nr:unnamed protein product [Polarella glacialis]
MPIQSGKYSWAPVAQGDEEAELRVVIPVEDTVKAKDCDISIGKKKLKAGVKGQEPIIDDAFFKARRRSDGGGGGQEQEDRCL